MGNIQGNIIVMYSAFMSKETVRKRKINHSWLMKVLSLSACMTVAPEFCIAFIIVSA